MSLLPDSALHAALAGELASAGIPAVYEPMLGGGCTGVSLRGLVDGVVRDVLITVEERRDADTEWAIGVDELVIGVYEARDDSIGVYEPVSYAYAACFEELVAWIRESVEL